MSNSFDDSQQQQEQQQQSPIPPYIPSSYLLNNSSQFNINNNIITSSSSIPSQIVPVMFPPQPQHSPLAPTLIETKTKDGKQNPFATW